MLESPARMWNFWSLVEKGEWESHTFTLIDLFLPEDKSFVDIGAWIGPFTLYAARKCRWVYVSEPDPIAREELQANLELNSITNVTVDSRAISNAAGVANMGNRADWGNSESSLLFSEQSIEVGTIRLEDFFLEHRIEDCALVKMDTEGGEALILPDAAGFLKWLDVPVCLSLHTGGDVDQEALREALRMWGLEWDGRPGEVLLDGAASRRYDAEIREAEIREHVELYTKSLHSWYGDLFRAGAEDFRHEVSPHSCQSGCWHTVEWRVGERKFYFESMWQRLVFERAIRGSLTLIEESAPRIG